MEDGCIPNDILSGELPYGKRTFGRHQLHFKDVFKCNMNALDINTESWEDAAADRSGWHSVLPKQLKSREEKILTTANEKRARWKACIPEVIPTCHTAKAVEIVTLALDSLATARVVAEAQRPSLGWRNFHS